MAFDDWDYDFEGDWYDPSEWDFGDWSGDFHVGDPFAGLDWGDWDFGDWNFSDWGDFDFAGSDPFSLPTANFELPDFDIGGDEPFLIPDMGPSPMSENLLDPNVITRFDTGIPGGTGLGGLDLSEFDIGSDVPALALPGAANVGGLGGNYAGLSDMLRTGEQEPAALSSTPESVGERIARMMSEREGAPPARVGRGGTDWAGLGQLGLGLAGLGLRYFGPEPSKKTDPLEEEERRARIAKINAETERTLNPIFPPRGGGGGGGGGGPLMPPPPGGAINVAEFIKAAGIDALTQRFDTLYNQVLKETQDIPKPTPEAITQTAQTLVQAQMPQIRKDFEQQRQGVLERANRMGVNPAAELAQINQAEQQAIQALSVQAQGQALAFMQAQQAALSGRLTPAVQILAQINPANAWADLARVFGFPRPGGQTPGLAGALAET